MPLTRTLGTATLFVLEDAAGTFFQPRAQAFPTASAEDWRRADELDPAALTPAGEWRLRFRCFAIRLDSGEVILVDTGIGPAGSPASSWAPVPGRLPDELAAAGIAAADVGTVVLTHLHTDHIGWAVIGDGRPYFSNARYVLQRTEYEAVTDLNPKLPAMLLQPLTEAGQLHLVDGSAPLGPGLSTVPTPGHTPGHQCVLATWADQRLLISGDLLVHAVQLVNPAVGYAIESDQDQARASRERQLRELAASAGTLATAHLSEPFHRPG
jgi:glyoxylase-like metal-dependent hydrolase (beta-lactamase superfamily II)